MQAHAILAQVHLEMAKYEGAGRFSADEQTPNVPAALFHLGVAAHSPSCSASACVPPPPRHRAGLPRSVQRADMGVVCCVAVCSCHYREAQVALAAIYQGAWHPIIPTANKVVREGL